MSLNLPCRKSALKPTISRWGSAVFSEKKGMKSLSALSRSASTSCLLLYTGKSNGAMSELYRHGRPCSYSYPNLLSRGMKYTSRATTTSSEPASVMRLSIFLFLWLSVGMVMYLACRVEEIGVQSL